SNRLVRDHVVVDVLDLGREAGDASLIDRYRGRCECHVVGEAWLLTVIGGAAAPAAAGCPQAKQRHAGGQGRRAANSFPETRHRSSPSGRLGHRRFRPPTNLTRAEDAGVYGTQAHWKLSV